MAYFKNRAAKLSKRFTDNAQITRYMHTDTIHVTPRGEEIEVSCASTFARVPSFNATFATVDQVAAFLEGKATEIETALGELQRRDDFEILGHRAYCRATRSNESRRVVNRSQLEFAIAN